MNKIFEAFKNQSADKLELFRKMHGYGVEEIEAIGADKFVKAMDFTSEDQVGKFETDVVHIGICPNCEDDFGLIELHHSLCPNCKDSFYYDFIDGLDPIFMPVEDSDEEVEMVSARAMFYMMPEFREKMKRNSKSIVDDLKEENYSGVVSYCILNSLLRDYYLRNITTDESVVSSLGKFNKEMSEARVEKGLYLKKDIPGLYEKLKEETGKCMKLTKFMKEQIDIVSLSLNLSLSANKLIVPEKIEKE